MIFAYLIPLTAYGSTARITVNEANGKTNLKLDEIDKILSVNSFKKINNCNFSSKMCFLSLLLLWKRWHFVLSVAMRPKTCRKIKSESNIDVISCVNQLLSTFLPEFVAGEKRANRKKRKMRETNNRQIKVEKWINGIFGFRLLDFSFIFSCGKDETEWPSGKVFNFCQVKRQIPSDDREIATEKDETNNCFVFLGLK